MGCCWIVICHNNYKGCVGLKKEKIWIIVGLLGIIALALWGKSQTMSVSSFGDLWGGLGSTGQYIVLGILALVLVVAFFYEEPRKK